MSKLQENCYWYEEEAPNGKVIRAMCVACHEKEQQGWFWNGEKVGYGDYDLNCSKCNKQIYVRESEDEK